MLARVFENFAGDIGRSLNSPSTLYIYPSILVPCARRPTPSLSHSLARGMLAHSSSTPVASTTIQSRSTRHAASFVEYACATIYLSLFFFLSISFALRFFLSFTLYLYFPLSHICTSFPFFSIFISLFRSRFILIKSLFFKKIISWSLTYKERSDEISFSLSLFLSVSPSFSFSLFHYLAY